MAVNKVEYKLDSVTSGFAVAGDEVQMKSSNAETIQKDVDEGVTEELTSGQQKYLDKVVSTTSTDSTDYETDSTDGEDLNDSEEENSSISTGEAGDVHNFGMPTLLATTAFIPFMNTFTATTIGAADLVLAISAQNRVSSFDSAYQARLSAASLNQAEMVDEYSQLLSEDLDAMNEAITEDTEFEDSEEQAGTEQDSILAQLKSALEDASANGDDEKVTEIESQISIVEAGGEISEEPRDTSLETVSINNELSHEVADESTEISNFLQEGDENGKVGMQNAKGLYGSVGTSAVLALAAFAGVDPFTINGSIAGSALCLTAGTKFGVAGAQMTSKANDELACAQVGNDIASSVESMQDSLADHDDKVVGLETVAEEAQEVASEGGGISSSEASTASAVASSVSSGSSSSGSSSSSSSSSS